MSPTRPLSRRAMLRGAGAAAVALPFLDAMARATPAPRRPVRMAYLYFPNGSAEGSWEPRRVGKGGELHQLNEWMKPLEPFKKDILIPVNLWTPRGNGHVADGRIHAGGGSVDQLAAASLGARTMLPSLELSLKGEGNFSKNLPRNNVSWTSATRPAVREIEPRIVFDRMFRAAESGSADRSVLDLVGDQAKSLHRRLGVSDRRKIEEYLEAIREIERRIEFAGVQSKKAAGAAKPAVSLERPAPGVAKDHTEYVRQMLDLLVLAFWSDATRICTFMLDHGQSNRYFNFIPGVKGTWHALSHWKDISGKTEDDDGVTGGWKSRKSKREMYDAVTMWHHEQLAYLLGRLKATRDGERSLLDNTILTYGSGIADGHEHAEENLPLIVAGRGGGSIRPGRRIRYREETPLERLHLATLQSMGVDVDRFGGAREPLPDLS